ncbi:MAG: class I SAM-dependent methyltransferase [Actinomycetota bacterium]|nr:class I SAM-dependent methyltransferase [Actinomycetota bacterium]
MAEIDQEALKKYSFAVWSYKQGEVVSALIHLGDRLGLFHAMAGVGRVDSHTLGESTGLHERFVREWLNGMAAARLISRVDDTYELSVEGAAVLADEEGAVTFSAGAFRGGFSPDTLDAIAESFRTGVGITYEQQGPSAAAGLARMTGPWTRHALVSTLLPRLDGVVDKLNNAARVVDIGCGAGVTTCTLAESFPNSTVVGYDPSTTAVSQAQELAGSKGLDNVEFIAAGGEDVPDDASADLVLTFDCLHDMPRPDITMEAIRKTIKSDGSWVIKDIRSNGDWDRDKRNPLLAMFYGFSVTSCLQSAMSEPGGMGLGTLGLHEAKAREMTAAAGFGRFTTHDIAEPANQYYEVKV